jgi:hypothetical protein
MNNEFKKWKNVNSSGPSFDPRLQPTNTAARYMQPPRMAEWVLASSPTQLAKWLGVAWACSGAVAAHRAHAVMRLLVTRRWPPHDAVFTASTGGNGGTHPARWGRQWHTIVVCPRRGDVGGSGLQCSLTTVSCGGCRWLVTVHAASREEEGGEAPRKAMGRSVQRWFGWAMRMDKCREGAGGDWRGSRWPDGMALQ